MKIRMMRATMRTACQDVNDVAAVGDVVVDGGGGDG